VSLKVSQGGTKIAVVKTEREARKLAKELLGVSRLHETPTVDGWQYWPSKNSDDTDDDVAVTVKVL
jgi:hypothetical protein